MAVCVDPIFIVGTERSGSNLLRQMLDAHSTIAVPHPPHVVRYFAPLERYYGDLRLDANLRWLAADMAWLVRRHIYPWPIAIDEAALVRDTRWRDLFGLYAGLYDQYAAAVGKPRWGCKSTFMVHHVDRIVERFPAARVIWLVRDPRDVAVSSQQSVFNPCHPYRTARLWKAQQDLALRWERTLRPENFRRVSYETLVTAPADTLQDLCRFIGAQFEPAMLSFFERREARRSASLQRDWANTARPVIATNVRKYRTQLPRRSLALVEAAAHDTMRTLGYELEAPAVPSPPGRLARAWILVQAAATRARVEWRSIRHDRNVWRRWRRWATLRAIALRARLRYWMWNRGPLRPLAETSGTPQ
jgi:hypothetical protein